MSFAGYDVGDAWGAPEPVTSGDIVADAMRKEKIIKSVSALQSLISAYHSLYIQGDTGRPAGLEWYVDHVAVSNTDD